MCIAIHGVTTSIISIARGTLGARMTCAPHSAFPVCPNHHTIDPRAQIGNRLPVLACVESKISLDLLDMTLLTAPTLQMTLGTHAQVSTHSLGSHELDVSTPICTGPRENLPVVAS